MDKIIKKSLSPFATKDDDAIRRISLKKGDVRPPFAVDRDRIIYSGAYRRCAGKTQVFYFSSQKDEQITNRILHIQYVSQIARTIGSYLALNNDLIEAAALGHDLGHTPFGHDGEKFLSRECEKYGIGKFHHNIHSLYIIDKFSYHGKGMNLTLQVKDAIVSHNGELSEKIITPNRKKTEKDIDLYVEAMKEKSFVDMKPLTLEGCVIRIADTIAYIGTDIEDGIRMGLIKRSDIPEFAGKILGTNNGMIIDSLVKDIISNSYNKDYIALSEKVSKALFELKKFNYKRIYNNDAIKISRDKIERGFVLLYEIYLQDLKSMNKGSDIYNHFLKNRNEKYLQETNDYIKVRDFIASMTDRYFKFQLEKNIIPM